MNKIEAIWDRVEEWADPKIDFVLGWSKRYSFPGFGGVPVYDTVKFIYNEMMRDNITTRANSVAYSLFIAIFPFIIFLFTLLPYLPISADYLNVLSEYITSALPSQAGDYLMEIIVSLVSIERGGLQSFGILFTIFFASSGMLTLMYGFDKTNNEKFKQRSYIRMRVVALLLTIVMSILFVSSFVFLVLGNLIMDQLESYYTLEKWMVEGLRIIKYVIAIFLLYVGIATIYKFGPSFKKKLPFFNTGATVATVLSIMTSLGFSYYVNNFGRYNELYGSIGALIVVMLWLQFNALVILIGFEFNASIVTNRGKVTVKQIKDE